MPEDESGEDNADDEKFIAGFESVVIILALLIGIAWHRKKNSK